MKTKFLLFLLIAISSSQITNAQIKKGTIFLGGQLGFATGKADGEMNDSKQSSYSFSPAIGIFTKDNLVWGGDIYLSGGKNFWETQGYQKYLGAGVGLFVRKYFPVANRLYLYGGGRFGVTYQKNEGDNTQTKTTIKGYTVAVSIYPGISYALKDNIHLEIGFNSLASVAYSHNKRTDNFQGINSHSTSNSFGLGGNAFNQSELSVGIRFLLNGTPGS